MRCAKCRHKLSAKSVRAVHQADAAGTAARKLLARGAETLAAPLGSLMGAANGPRKTQAPEWPADKVSEGRPAKTRAGPSLASSLRARPTLSRPCGLQRRWSLPPSAVARWQARRTGLRSSGLKWRTTMARASASVTILSPFFRVNLLISLADQSRCRRLARFICAVDQIVANGFGDLAMSSIVQAHQPRNQVHPAARLNLRICLLDLGALRETSRHAPMRGCASRRRRQAVSIT